MNYDQIISEEPEYQALWHPKVFDILEEMTDAISLGIGEPDFVTLAHPGRWHLFLERGHTKYTSNAGMLELRRDRHHLRRRFDLEYDYTNQILVTVGGSDHRPALRVLVNPGTRSSSRTLLRAHGPLALRWPEASPSMWS